MKKCHKTTRINKTRTVEAIKDLLDQPVRAKAQAAVTKTSHLNEIVDNHPRASAMDKADPASREPKRQTLALVETTVRAQAIQVEGRTKTPTKKRRTGSSKSSSSSKKKDMNW